MIRQGAKSVHSARWMASAGAPSEFYADGGMRKERSASDAEMFPAGSARWPGTSSVCGTWAP